MKRALALLLVAALAACGESGEGTAEQAVVPKAAAPKVSAGAASDDGIGTPVEDRVATLGLLNKRNNLTQSLVMKSGESRRVGNVIVKLEACEKTKPWERPEEEGAFVQVFVEERATASDKLAWHKVFSGWLFKRSPSLNVVEHPVYDVWVKDCAMSFPGEETPVTSPSGRPSGNAAPARATPAPSPSPAPAAPAAEANTEA